MKKIITALFIFLLLSVFGCSKSENDEPAELVVPVKEEIVEEEIVEEEIVEETVISEEFVSVWPDELPGDESLRPLQIDTVVEVNGRTGYDKLIDYQHCYFLYDLPDFNLYFDTDGRLFMDKRDLDGILPEGENIPTLVYYCQKKDGEIGDITKDDILGYIDALTEAGYTENAYHTENGYHCEKYGVGVEIEVSSEFPWEGYDERAGYPGNFVTAYLRFYLVNPDYKFDLEKIKEEEYAKWLESHNE